MPGRVVLVDTVSEDWELSLSRERVTIGLYNALLNIRNAKRHGITETCNVGHVIGHVTIT